MSYNYPLYWRQVVPNYFRYYYNSLHSLVTVYIIVGYKNIPMLVNFFLQILIGIVRHMEAREDEDMDVDQDQELIIIPVRDKT